MGQVVFRNPSVLRVCRCVQTGVTFRRVSRSAKKPLHRRNRVWPSALRLSCGSRAVKKKFWIDIPGASCVSTGCRDGAPLSSALRSRVNVSQFSVQEIRDCNLSEPSTCVRTSGTMGLLQSSRFRGHFSPNFEVVGHWKRISYEAYWPWPGGRASISCTPDPSL